MAEKCITYLLYLIEEDISLTEATVDQYPFARLSAELWVTFYKGAAPHTDAGFIAHLDALAIKLFAHPKAVLKWIRLSVPDQWDNRAQFDLPESKVKSAMYYASYLGLPRILNHFITIDHAVDDISPDGTPLVAAIAHRHKEVVILLLDRGADPNLSGTSRWGSPLAEAIEVNDTEIVDVLLNKYGVDIHGLRASPRLVDITGVLNEGEDADQGSAVTTKDHNKTSQTKTKSAIMAEADAGAKRSKAFGEENDHETQRSNESMVYIAARYAL